MSNAVPPNTPMPLNQPVSGLWVDQQEQLSVAVADILQSPAIALDTEFVRRNTYYAVLGLIQIATPTAIYLVDPLAKLNFQPLAQALANSSITKVFHSVGEDLEVLRDSLMRQHGLELAGPIFDTQLAATLAGLGGMLSLAKLVQQMLGQTLDKAETTSNWLIRPLSAAQIAYAAEDVRVLVPIHAQLHQQLSQLNRLQWLLEDGEKLLQRSINDAIDRQPHHRHKASVKLHEAAQMRLRALLIWREQKARDRNLPKNWVVPIEAVFELAERLYRDEDQFQRELDRLAPKSSKRGPELWKLVQNAEASAASDPVFEPIPAALKGSQAEQYKKLRELADQKAAELGIPGELLANRKVLEHLVLQPIGTTLPGWRGGFVGLVE